MSPDAVAALTLVGTAFDQDVTQHRVDKVSTLYNPGASMSLDGNVISVGCLSDSYDTRTAAPHPAQDVAGFDLPRAAGNPTTRIRFSCFMMKRPVRAPMKPARLSRRSTKWRPAQRWVFRIPISVKLILRTRFALLPESTAPISRTPLCRDSRRRSYARRWILR